MESLPGSLVLWVATASLALNGWFLRGVAHELKEVKHTVTAIRVEHGERIAALEALKEEDYHGEKERRRSRKGA